VSRRRFTTGLAALALTTVGLAGCGSDDDPAASGSGGGGGDGVELRLGYFPNLTHAPGIVGVDQHIFDDALGDVGATVTPSEFNSGTDTIEAIVNGDLDVTYIGPSPALTGYSTNPDTVRLIAGATSGGASLVVNPDEISSVEDLEGKTLATPSLGNTQDIAARYWLQEQGFETTQEGGGDVSLLPQDNSVTIQTYEQGEIQGGWLPEPYPSILEQQGAEVLLDEAELWPDGQFVTTHVLVNTEFLEANPDIVEAFLEGHVEAIKYLNDNSEQARDEVGAFLEESTGTAIEPDILASAWDRLTFTNDPLAATLYENAEHAEAVGLLEPIDDIEGIYELDTLNGILADEGQEEVSAS
jgi:NitT/TauT family transport system substrate-binding protein